MAGESFTTLSSARARANWILPVPAYSPPSGLHLSQVPL